MSTDDERPAPGTDETGTDETGTGETGTDETGTATDAAAPGAPAVPRPPARRPSPAASAASRARRIGGSTRPVRAPDAGATPSPAGDTEADDDAGTGAATTSLTKPGRPAKPARPARPTRAEKAAGVLPPPPAGAPARRPSTGTAATAVADKDADTDEDADTDGDAPTTPPAWLNWAPAAVLIAGALTMAVIIALVSHGVWWGTDTRSQKGVETLREKVLASAKTCVVRTNTYKYNDLKTFEKTGLACTTGKQSTDFRTAVDKVLATNAPKLKSSQSAQINKAAIESVVGKQWTILVFGQLQVVNSSTPTGRTDPFAALVRMQQVGGKWLISSLRTVSSPVN